MTQLYRVTGEYGPTADMSVEQLIEADSPEAAKEVFITDTMLMQPALWDRIGRRNVYVEEIGE